MNKVALPDFTGVASTDILSLRPTADIDRPFLAFVLRSGYMRAETSRRTNGQLPRIAPKALAEIAIPVPPLEVQHDLGAFLQRFADLIDRCHDSSEALLRVPVTHLRTITPTRSRKRSWPEASLEELSISFDYGMTASAASGTSQRGRGSHRFVRISDIDDFGRLRPDGAIYFQGLSKRELTRYELSEGDLLFARTGYSIGDTYLYRTSDGPAVFASYLIRARLLSDRVDPMFVATLLGSREARATIWHAGRGAGKPNLNIPRVAGLTIPVPPRDIQLEVVALAEASRAPSARLRLLRGQLLDLVIAVTDRALRGRVSTTRAASPPLATTARTPRRPAHIIR